jgi:hypothetical protein
MERQVFLFNIEEKEALGFDTGLDSRAFARTRFAHFITEPGFIVGLDGPTTFVNVWKAGGVVEHSAMVVWGPPFKGERLDFLLHDNGKRDETLAAIRRWIQAVLALGEKHRAPVSAPPLWPCAALIGESQSIGEGQSSEVFFAPPGIALHCLMAQESNKINKLYVQPDLEGMNAAAFTAAAMLYRVFTGSAPFRCEDEIIRHEDMREGNFLPIHLAAPGLDDKLAALIQRSLSQSAKRGGLPNGARLLEEFLAVLRKGSPDSFFRSLSEEDTLSVEKEKTQFLKTKTASVKAKRFVTRNSALLIGGFVALFIAVLVANSTIRGRSALSTANMEPAQVIESYYDAFGKMDHLWMEACVVKGVGKDDINMVMGYFLVSKIRQAYEYSTNPFFISAKDWLESGGGKVELQVFGVTGLQLTINNEQLTMNSSNEARYRVDYTLWVPDQPGDRPRTEQNVDGEYLPPVPFRRTDFVTLVQKNGKWLISEITRGNEELEIRNEE